MGTTPRGGSGSAASRAGLGTDVGLHLQLGWGMFSEPFESKTCDARRKAYHEFKALLMRFEPGPGYDPIGTPRTEGTFPDAYYDFENVPPDTQRVRRFSETPEGLAAERRRLDGEGK